jgi:hypothetical protein
MTIWQGNILPIANSSSNYRFNFTLDSPPDNIENIFAVLVGYSIVNTACFDFFTNIISMNPSALVF